MTHRSVLDVHAVPPPDGPSPGDPVTGSRRVVDPHEPVRDVHDLVRHVEGVVPVAVRRQLWTLFFDDDDVALPLMVPLEGVPECPDLAALDHYGDALAAVTTEFGAASVAFLLERPGPSTTRPSDRRWADGLVALAGGRPFRVRPVLVCGDHGVSPVAAGPTGRSLRPAGQASSSPVRLADIVRLP